MFTENALDLRIQGASFYQSSESGFVYFIMSKSIQFEICSRFLQSSRRKTDSLMTSNLAI